MAHCAESATVGFDLSGPLGKPHGRVYVRRMDATQTSMKDTLPAAAAGTIGAGMSFTICAAMSFTVVSDTTHSG
jgi:hypothetical protein